MKNNPLRVTIHIDGGARGNPGPAAAAIIISDTDDGAALIEKGFFLGTATNNVAEYKSLLAGLEAAASLAAAEVDVCSDSQLLVRQITGEYRVKNAGLRPLFAEALKRKAQFAGFTIRHIRRDQNKLADRLVNMAIDAQADIE